MKNLLIVGGAGYIGRQIVKILENKKQFNIFVIDNLSTTHSLGLTVTRYPTSLEIERASAFTITCQGGSANTKLNVLQDQVDNVSQLPFQSKNCIPPRTASSLSGHPTNS